MPLNAYDTIDGSADTLCEYFDICDVLDEEGVGETGPGPRARNDVLLVTTHPSHTLSHTLSHMPSRPSHTLSHTLSHTHSHPTDTPFKHPRSGHLSISHGRESEQPGVFEMVARGVLWGRARPVPSAPGVPRPVRASHRPVAGEDAVCS